MKKCFIVSPIGAEGSEPRKHADEVMEYILTPTLKDSGYEVIRADFISTSQNISKNIITNIVEADLIIADLTTHNPNVFYELAVSHSLAKPTIQIIKKGDSLPFDVSHQRTLIYELNLPGAKKAISELKSFIEEFNKEDFQIENPVLDVVNLNNIKNLNTDDITVNQALKELTNEIKRMQESISNLESKPSSNVNETSGIMTTEIMKGMTQEEKLGMVLMDRMLANPNMSELFIKKMLNSN
ncbi:MAG: hypothetical protein ACRC51_03935 [Cetobacterium sp.]